MLDSTAGYSGLDPAELVVEALDLLYGNRPEWWNRAACRGQGVETFFPTRGVSVEPARAVCARCPVVDDCLGSALDNQPTYGVWGGMSERQRIGIRAISRRPAA